jgi:hypothetical protein
MGVRSKSKDSSFRGYNGATHYNEWAFMFSSVSNRPGVGRGVGQPGMAPGASPFNPAGGGRGAGGRGVGGRGSDAPRGFGPGMRGIGRGPG